MAVAGDEVDAGFVAVTGLVESACLLNNVNGANGIELSSEISLKLLSNGLYLKSL